jgi:DNA-binding transcriptional ArsR family regulator
MDDRLQETDFKKLERFFLALGDKTRLRLLALMADGPVAVGFLADRLGESQPKVSRHLAYLRNADVVFTEREGKWIYYGIKQPENASMKQVLDTVVRSIAAIRVDGEYVYFTEGSDIDEYQPTELENITYVDPYMYESEDPIVESEEQTEEEIFDEDNYRSEEIDVFLL